MGDGGRERKGRGRGREGKGRREGKGGGWTLCSDKFSFKNALIQPRLSFPRPFQQSLACFRVARSPSNS